MTSGVFRYRAGGRWTQDAYPDIWALLMVSHELQDSSRSLTRPSQWWTLGRLRCTLKPLQCLCQVAAVETLGGDVHVPKVLSDGLQQNSVLEKILSVRIDKRFAIHHTFRYHPKTRFGHYGVYRRDYVRERNAFPVDGVNFGSSP